MKESVVTVHGTQGENVTHRRAETMEKWPHEREVDQQERASDAGVSEQPTAYRPNLAWPLFL